MEMEGVVARQRLADVADGILERRRVQPGVEEHATLRVHDQVRRYGHGDQTLLALQHEGPAARQEAAGEGVELGAHVGSRGLTRLRKAPTTRSSSSAITARGAGSARFPYTTLFRTRALAVIGVSA